MSSQSHKIVLIACLAYVGQGWEQRHQEVETIDERGHSEESKYSSGGFVPLRSLLLSVNQAFSRLYHPAHVVLGERIQKNLERNGFHESRFPVMADGGGRNGNSGGGNDGRGGGGGRWDEGDQDDEGEHEEDDEGANDADPLPKDMSQALEAGRIGETELSNWKRVLRNPFLRALASIPYVRNRLLASPGLPRVLAIECLLGAISVLLADKAARGSNFIKELDFVFANQMLVVLTNIALVLALTPAAPVAPPPLPKTLAAFGAQLPSYMLQKGSFSVAQRVACVFSKALQFSFVGVLTSALGQATTISLVKARKWLNPNGAMSVELAPVLPTCVAYAAFMAGSSNPRYQIVNSFEGLLLPKLPGGVQAKTLTSSVVRTLNNYCGAATWIWWAKYRGLQ